jgi:hypothetical protein
MRVLVANKKQEEYIMEIFVSLIVVVAIIGIFYFQKRDKQKRNISIVIALISFLIFGIFFTDDEENNEKIASDTSQISNVEQVDEVSNKEAENEKNSEVATKAEENEEIEEAENKEESADIPRVLEKFDHEKIDDIDIYINSSGVTWSAGQHTEHFLMDVADVVKLQHEELQNGALFTSENEFVDNYGNEDTQNGIIVYLKLETIEKINVDNEIWGAQPSDLYNVADAVWIHSEFQTDEFTGISGASDESIPQTYFNLIEQ